MGKPARAKPPRLSISFLHQFDSMHSRAYKPLNDKKRYILCHVAPSLGSSSCQRTRKQQQVEAQVGNETRKPFLTVPKQVVRASRQSRGPKRHARVGLFVLLARLREFFTAADASKRYSVHLVCSVSKHRCERGPKGSSESLSCWFFNSK